MTNEITVDLSEWTQFALLLEKDSAKLLNKHMTNAMDASLDFILDLIVRVYMGQQHGKNPAHGKNTGALSGSFAKEIFGSLFDMTGIVATPLAYGLPVETGRGPGRMPPVDKIKLWVINKMKLQGKKADQAAFLIARAIGRHGTEGVWMVKQAFERAVSGNEIDTAWGDELEKFLEELAR